MKPPSLFKQACLVAVFVALALLSFVPTPTASPLMNATFEEVVNSSGVTTKGSDLAKPELITLPASFKTAYTNLEFTPTASTSGFGPTAKASVVGHGSASHPGWTWLSGVSDNKHSLAEATIRHQYQVINYGDREMFVPILVDAFMYVAVNTSGTGGGNAYAAWGFQTGDFYDKDGTHISRPKGYLFESTASFNQYGQDLGPQSVHDSRLDQLAFFVKVAGTTGYSNLKIFDMAIQAKAYIDVGCSAGWEPILNGDPFTYKMVTHSGAAAAYAMVDPLVRIDPTWEYADLFEVTVSPGIVQAVNTTPIPANVWLLASGLALLLGRGFRSAKK